MEKQFVDDFFESGKLRLSSFAKFGKHKNEEMKDTKEGKISLKINCGKLRAETKIGFGHNAFVLCGTTVNNIEHAQSVFKQSSGFSIENMDAFINAIINAIHQSVNMQVEFVNHGSCMYLLEREHEVTILNLEEDNFNSFFGMRKNGIDFQRMNEIIAQFAAEHSLFLKQSKYSSEHEYRIIFNIEENEIPEYIDIIVPEAAKYCRRIDFENK